MVNTLGRVYRVKKIWYIDYSDGHGRRTRKKIGEHKHLALIALNNAKTALAEQRAGIKRMPKKLFSEFADEYLEFHSKMNKPTSYRRDIDSIRQLKKHFGNRYLDDINTLDVRKFMAKGKDAPVSRNGQFTILKSILNRAIEGEYLIRNPCKGIKKYKEIPRLRYLEYDEIENLLSHAEGMIKAIITTAVFTGMRKSELFGLRWEDCDFDRRLIHLAKTKNDTPRYIPMPDRVYKIIKAIPKYRNSPYVFYKKDGTQYSRGIRKPFDKLLKTCKIKDFRWHDMRHCYASLLRMGGTDLEDIGALLGHKTLSMTARYAHLSPDYLKKSIECLNVGTKLAQANFKKKDKSMDLSQFFVNKGVM